MTIRHSIRVNPRGMQGRTGLKGDAGFSPIVEVVPIENSTAFRLKITNKDNVVLTPIIKSIEFTDMGGTYIREVDGLFYLMNADSASTTQKGEVILATSNDIVSNNDYKAVTPALMKTYTDVEISNIVAGALPNNGYNFRGTILNILDTESDLPDVGTEGDIFIIKNENKIAEWTTSHWEITTISNLLNGDLWRLSETQNGVFYLFEDWYYLGGQVIEQSEITTDTYRVGLQDVISRVATKSEYVNNLPLIETAIVQDCTSMPKVVEGDVSIDPLDLNNISYDIIKPSSESSTSPTFLLFPLWDRCVDSVLFKAFKSGLSFYNNDFAIREELLVTQEFSSTEIINAIRAYVYKYIEHSGLASNITTDILLFCAGIPGTTMEANLDIQWRNEYVLSFTLGSNRFVMSKNAIYYLLGNNDINYGLNTFYNISNETYVAKYPLNTTQESKTCSISLEVTPDLRKLIRTPKSTSYNSYKCKPAQYNPAGGENMGMRNATISLPDSTICSVDFLRIFSTYENALTLGVMNGLESLVSADIISKEDAKNIPDVDLINYIQGKLSSYIGMPIQWYQNGNLHPTQPLLRYENSFTLRMNMANLPLDICGQHGGNNDDYYALNNVPSDGILSMLGVGLNRTVHLNRYGHLEDIEDSSKYAFIEFTYQEYFEANNLPSKKLNFIIDTVAETNPPVENIKYFEVLFNSSDLNFNIYDNNGNIITPTSITLSSFTSNQADDEGLEFVEYSGGKLYFIDKAIGNILSIGSAICNVTITFNLNNEELTHKEYVTIYAFRGEEYIETIPNLSNEYDIEANKIYRCLSNGLLKYKISTDDEHNMTKLYIGQSANSLVEMASVNQSSSGDVGISITECVNLSTGTFFKCEEAGKFYSVVYTSALEEIV